VVAAEELTRPKKRSRRRRGKAIWCAPGLKHELALIGLWLLKHIYGLSDEGVSER
jgi:hypothetical protein